MAMATRLNVEMLTDVPKGEQNMPLIKPRKYAFTTHYHMSFPFNKTTKLPEVRIGFRLMKSFEKMDRCESNISNHYLALYCAATFGEQHSFGVKKLGRYLFHSEGNHVSLCQRYDLPYTHSKDKTGNYPLPPLSMFSVTI